MTATLDRKETYRVCDTEDISLEEHTGDEILLCVKKPIMLIWYNGNLYSYQVLPNTNTDFNRSALESNFFPVIYNGELRVLDLWLSDCLDAEISAKMDLKTFTRRILIDEKSLLR